jgi:hypothetical protein
MTDEELLAKVKTGLSVGGTYNDATLKIKTTAVKEYMLNAGITQEQIETDLGIATLTVGVADLWNLNPGEVKFSDAFTLFLMPQLMVVSIPDV